MNTNFKKQPFDIEDVFRVYNIGIYRFIYSRTNGNKQLAEDIAQETFIRAWEKAHQFNVSKGSIKTWLFTIARNLLVDYFRKHKNHTETISEFEEVESDENIEKETEKEILRGKILDGLKKLGEKDSEYIVMRYINELEIKEISLVLNKPENTVKVAIHRAVIKLKKILNNG